MIPTIHVIATTFDGTRAALGAAAPLASREQARVILLLPRTAADDVERPTQSVNWLIARYDQMSRDLNQPVQVRVCLGPNLKEAVAQTTPAKATVFVGGRTSVFWPTAEERLAASLRRSGRTVVFVGCNKGSLTGQRADVDA